MQSHTTSKATQSELTGWIAEHEKTLLELLKHQMEEMLMFGEVVVNVNVALANSVKESLHELVDQNKIPISKIQRILKLIDTLDLENIQLANAIIKRYEQ